MAQTLKHEIRNSILEAALKTFSEKGYVNSTMSDIAAAAGISTGNIYRYFSDKDTLFYTVLPKSISDLLQQAVRDKMDLWNRMPLSSSDPSLHQGQENLLNVLMQYRRQFVILFKHSQGTIYENISEEMSGYFMQLFGDYLASIGQKEKYSDTGFRNAAGQIYKNIIAAFANILSSDHNEESVLSSLRSYLEYHMAGLERISADHNK